MVALRKYVVPRRLASKLILALTVIVLIVKAITLYFNLQSQELQLRQSITAGADQLSRSITSATWQSMLANRRDVAYEVMNTIGEKQGIDRIQMYNKDGHMMFSSVADQAHRLDPTAEPCSPCHSQAKPLVNVDVKARTRLFHRASDNRRTLTMMTPIYNEPSCSQASCHAHPANVKVLGVLYLTMDASRIDVETAALRRRTALMTLLEIAVLAAFLAFATSQLVEKPIQKLIVGTKAISRMNLEHQIEISSSEELAELSDSFNVMRERLKESLEQNAKFTQQLETKVEERTAQLRLAQQKLLQTDRLASLGQLAASVAHEINNPISGVLNLAMLMQRIMKEGNIPPNRVEDFRRYLGQVASETSRVGHIVSDLLSFSRRSKPQAVQADLNSIIRTTISLVSHKLQLANVEVVSQLSESLPAIRCDASQIQQVVMNLVLNGAEAIKGGGRLTIHTRRAEDGKAVILQVTDTGTGMPPEVLNKIFDPFFTTKEDGKGVGLGLAVVYGIIESHGGDIEVKSTVGAGTTFTVTLPLTAVELPPVAVMAGAF